ncbi:hypothetical protein S7711_05006 [Stachybotrys chartarum IBT 7711]|uniref:Clock-controlled protein 8 n=1 Tax=Stachybotrys chartarum (strain CBS 109288 / IBT 7711) TaxID=1280523 RepID=A0A084ARD9_STACB|nr:hypothetical protein S7711_05006 [Stachybotrys chartarum IBT 7711]
MEAHHMLARREGVTTAQDHDRDRNRNQDQSRSATTTARNDPGPPPPMPVWQANPQPRPILPPVQPPLYAHAVSSIQLPDVPSAELPPPRSWNNVQHDNETTLPALSTITSGQPYRTSGWLSSNSLGNYRQPVQHQALVIDSPAADVDTASTGTLSAASPDRGFDARASSVSTLSLDDPDVRLAAEALGDLRADFVSSPTNSNVTLPPIASPVHGSQSALTVSPQQPEPLLQLLTIDHPILARTISNASSAYGGVKELSPRFIKSGAEYVEGYLTPIANTVGSVARVTGVEGGIRSYLGRERRQSPRPSDLEAGTASHKRRKITTTSDAVAVEDSGAAAEGIRAAQDPDAVQNTYTATPRDSRRVSMASTVESLPAYDDARIPAYAELKAPSQSTAVQGSTASNTWQSRVFISTSGLSVAMSQESLRCLRACLGWLRQANDRILEVIDNVKHALHRWDSAGTEENNGLIDSKEAGDSRRDAIRSQLAQEARTLKDDFLRILQDVINRVSRTAAGALPENARELVRSHFLSVPARFRLAAISSGTSRRNSRDDSQAIDAQSASRQGVHLVLIMAQEGVEMLAQVSKIVGGTINSAEEWCERLGRRNGVDNGDAERQRSEKQQPPRVEPNGDVKMVDVKVEEDVKMG